MTTAQSQLSVSQQRSHDAAHLPPFLGGFLRLVDSGSGSNDKRSTSVWCKSLSLNFACLVYRLSIMQLTCLLVTVPASGCSLTDNVCQCSNTDLTIATAACLQANCTVQDTLGTTAPVILKTEIKLMETQQKLPESRPVFVNCRIQTEDKRPWSSPLP